MNRRPAGVALISVLLIVSIATALAYHMMSRHALSVAYSSLVLNGSQARQYALGGEEYARQILYEDWKEPDTHVNDTLLEIWAQHGGGADADNTADGEDPEHGYAARPSDDSEETVFQAFAVEDGTVQIRIDDLSARFNLNAVLGERSAQNMARLQRLLRHVGLDPNVADRWRDWLDEDQDVQGFGAEDSEYLLADLPRRPANQRAFHASEVLVPADLLPAQFEMLRPHVTVLPVFDQRTNVNTASEVVLGILAPNFPPGEAQKMLGEPREFENVEAVIASYAPLGESAGALAIRSEFFRVQVRAEVGDVYSDLTSMLHRDQASGFLTVLSRSFGERFEHWAQDVAIDEDGAPRRRWAASGGTGDEPQTDSGV